MEFVVKHNILERMQQLSDVFGTGKIAPAAGRGAANCIRDHLAGLESTRPNKKNWPRQHFWASAARSVQNPKVSGDNATVSVNKLGLAQRFYGGDIFPTGGKRFLTIPAVPEAYGKTAGQFNNLHFGFGLQGFLMRPALIEAEHTKVKFGRKKKDGTRTVTAGPTVGGGVVFWLYRFVHQDPDPDVMPKPETVGKAAADAARDFIEAQVDQKGTS